jgi:prevent-host-death family protein
MTISIEQAQLKFAEMIAQAERGEQVVLTSDGKPVVKLVKVEPPPPRKRSGFGSLKGLIEFPVPADDKSHLADFKEYME